MLLEQLKRDPTYLAPVAILSRLGAEATVELFEYGDQVEIERVALQMEWRARGAPAHHGATERIRPHLRARPLLPQQRPAGTGHDSHPPHGPRAQAGPGAAIGTKPRRSSVSIAHTLPRRRSPGDLGFDGETHWLMPDEPAPAADGPSDRDGPHRVSHAAGGPTAHAHPPHAYGRRRLSPGVAQTSKNVGRSRRRSGMGKLRKWRFGSDRYRRAGVRQRRTVVDHRHPGLFAAGLHADLQLPQQGGALVRVPACSAWRSSIPATSRWPASSAPNPQAAGCVCNGSASPFCPPPAISSPSPSCAPPITAWDAAPRWARRSWSLSGL